MTFQDLRALLISKRLLQSRIGDYVEKAIRVGLSQYVANGMTVTVGLVVIMLLILETAGFAGASSAAVGILITSIPDQPAPRKRKIMQMLPSVLLGTPLFALVQLVDHDVWLLGIVLVAGVFLATMMMAWGKRGGPITFSLIFAMVFSMAAPKMETLEQIAVHVGWFLLGGVLYLIWAVITTHVLNQRFRSQLLAECLHSFAAILRTQSKRFSNQFDQTAVLAEMLAQQAAFAELIQSTRDVVLESPTTAPRQRVAAMLLSLLEARDHQLACDLDLDFLLEQDGTLLVLPSLQHTLLDTADELDTLSLALLLGLTSKNIPLVPDLRAQLKGAVPYATARAARDPSTTSPTTPEPLLTESPDEHALLNNMVDRIGHINDEATKISAIARGDVAAEIADVRTQWQLFVSTTRWAAAPLLGQLTWRAPTLRYALRAAIAVAVAYGVSLHLPWAAHKYWILATAMVVMRGNLAQTLERRNARVAGTLTGSLFVMAFLLTHPAPREMFLVIALSMGFAHAFALRRYLYASIFATIAGLLQAHLLLGAELEPQFAIWERLADTILGASIAWMFSYVLPAWERNQIPGLVKRSVTAQLQHAKRALALLDSAQTSDVHWRLARKEAYDSLSALTLATQRSLAEPEKVRPALQPLETLQARSYQLLAQLTAIKSMLLLRRAQLDLSVAVPALDDASRKIENALKGDPATATSTADAVVAGQPYQQKPDALIASDLTPWLLRRLVLATSMAHELQLAASKLKK